MSEAPKRFTVTDIKYARQIANQPLRFPVERDGVSRTDDSPYWKLLANQDPAALTEKDKDDGR